MFDFASSELLVCAVVALLVIGPKELPKAMRFVGNWVGKARRMAGHFRAGMDAMMREAELKEMEDKWRAHNEAIMRAHPHVTPMDGVEDAGVAATTPLPAGTEQSGVAEVRPATSAYPAAGAQQIAEP